jgi:hypothetical protein
MVLLSLVFKSSTALNKISNSLKVYFSEISIEQRGDLTKKQHAWFSQMSEDERIEHNKKISNSLKGRIFSKEHKKKISAALKGRIFSDEHRKKLSEAAKKNKAMRCVCIQPPVWDLGCRWSLQICGRHFFYHLGVGKHIPDFFTVCRSENQDEVGEVYRDQKNRNKKQQNPKEKTDERDNRQ